MSLADFLYIQYIKKHLQKQLRSSTLFKGTPTVPHLGIKIQAQLQTQFPNHYISAALHNKSHKHIIDQILKMDY